MTYLVRKEERQKLRSVRFVRRVFFLRQLGTLLCFISFVPVLQHMHYGILVWVLLGINAFVWPTIAYLLSIYSKNVLKMQHLSLTLDTFLGGIWVALMAVNPVPSLILIAVFIADRYTAGGWLLLRSSAIAFCSSFLTVWTFLGFPHETYVSAHLVWASLPLATIYIMALSIISRNLSTRLTLEYRKMEQIAMMDPQLHIPNRRLFEQHLVDTFIQSQRGEYAAYLLLLDVDNFKNVNDTFGHEVGDYVLREISVILKKLIQVEDFPARYGGDELALIVLNYNQQQVLALAQQICDQVYQISIPNHSQYRPSISIGVAAATRSQSTLDWLEQADQALYRVKRQGRNGLNLCSA